MDFYSSKTLSMMTEYSMQLGSKKKNQKLQKVTLSQKTFSCKPYPAVEAWNQRSEKCAKKILFRCYVESIVRASVSPPQCQAELAGKFSSEEYASLR